MDDRWLATGDIAEWRLDGKLQIIDRKKSLFKLAQGEYVRPTFVENICKMSPFVANAFVYGNSIERYLVAVFQPDFTALDALAKRLNVDAGSLLTHPQIISAVHSDLNAIFDKEQLNGFERVHKFLFVNEEFSAETGVLTASMKIRDCRFISTYQYFKPLIDCFQTLI